MLRIVYSLIYQLFYFTDAIFYWIFNFSLYSLKIESKPKFPISISLHRFILVSHNITHLFKHSQIWCVMIQIFLGIQFLQSTNIIWRVFIIDKFLTMDRTLKISLITVQFFQTFYWFILFPEQSDNLPVLSLFQRV